MARPNHSVTYPATGSRNDTERETREAIIYNADKTDGADRDLVYGRGDQPSD